MVLVRKKSDGSLLRFYIADLIPKNSFSFVPILGPNTLDCLCLFVSVVFDVLPLGFFWAFFPQTPNERATLNCSPPLRSRLPTIDAVAHPSFHLSFLPPWVATHPPGSCWGWRGTECSRGHGVVADRSCPSPPEVVRGPCPTEVVVPGGGG